MAEDAARIGVIITTVVDFSAIMVGHGEAGIGRILVTRDAQPLKIGRIKDGKHDRVRLLAHRMEMSGQNPQIEIRADGKQVGGTTMRVMTLDAEQLKGLFLLDSGYPAGQIGVGGDPFRFASIVAAEAVIIAAAG
jgi:hypothetical protein